MRKCATYSIPLFLYEKGRESRKVEETRHRKFNLCSTNHTAFFGIMNVILVISRTNRSFNALSLNLWKAMYRQICYLGSPFSKDFFMTGRHMRWCVKDKNLLSKKVEWVLHTGQKSKKCLLDVLQHTKLLPKKGAGWFALLRPPKVSSKICITVQWFSEYLCTSWSNSDLLVLIPSEN